MPVRLPLLALLIVPAALPAPLPEFYKSVYRVSFVVKDASAVSGAWNKLGAEVVQGPNRLEIHGTFRGKPASGEVEVTTSATANVLIDWIQPIAGENAFVEFQKKHGDGVFGLMHKAPSPAVLEAEIARLSALGVGVLHDSKFEVENGTIRAVYFDTLEEGKYALGLISEPEMSEQPSFGSGPLVSQFAFVARELDPVSRYWAKLGFPELAFTSGKLSDLVYKGESGKFTSRLGWQRHGTVVYEWIEPKEGPSSYLDHLARSGEGLHHFGVNVPEMDKAVAEYKTKGFPFVMGGAWGEKGKVGSGRFMYHDAPGGVEIELLWNYRAN